MASRPMTNGKRDFQSKVYHDFLEAVQTDHLVEFTKSLHDEYLEAAHSSKTMMLPSHIDRLPTGKDATAGIYVADAYFLRS